MPKKGIQSLRVHLVTTGDMTGQLSANRLGEGRGDILVGVVQHKLSFLVKTLAALVCEYVLYAVRLIVFKFSIKPNFLHPILRIFFVLGNVNLISKDLLY